MKLIKSLLLGSAAGLVAVAGAQAADLGIKKPSAVEYVKTCPTYGAGFFVVPGTTSCLKIVGRVRVDYLFANDQSALRAVNGAAPALVLGRTKDKNVFRARAYLGFDHRTATEYGLLRTYVRLYTERNNATSGFTGQTPSTSITTNSGINIEYAFIQFGGLTVGRVTPVFETGYNAHIMNAVSGGTGGFSGMSDIYYVNSIGYTANFGGGFSASVALDSARERQVGVISQTAAGAFAAGGAAYGQSMPDVVAALAYTAAWGEVKLSGAVHQVRGGLATGAISTKYGYAGQIGAKINLPFLAKGSNIWGVASIANGASSYTGWTANGGGLQIGQYTIQATDAVITTAAGVNSMHLTKSWGLAGGIQAFVTPTVFVALSGSYGQHDQFGVRNTIKGSTVTGGIGWTPVAGFLIGGEVQYRAFQVSAAAANVTALAAGVGPAAKSEVISRVRFQRDF
jgi:Porin subfamily